MIVGRTSELDRLGERLETARNGEADPVLVVGEPGVGKSTLLAAVAHRATSRGFTVVRARAPEGEAEVAYALAEDLVRAQSASLPLLPPDDRELLERLGHVGSSRGRVAGALTRLVWCTVQRGPVLLVIDDLHWADTLSLAALTLALGRLQGSAVATVAAARPIVGDDPRLMRWERLELGPLGVADAAALLRSVVPTPIDREQAGRVVTALGCNPLAISECARLLTADQLVGTDELPDPFPMGPRLQAAWGRTAAGLPERAARATLALCVVGENRLDLLTGVLDASGLGLDDLDPAVDAGLVCIDTVGRPRAMHPLVHGAVLEQASSAERREMQRRAAEVARRTGQSPAVVVRHLVQGAREPDETTAAAIAHEAERAGRRDQIVVAARAWESAARLTRDPALRATRALNAARLRISESQSFADARPLLALLESMELPPRDSVYVEWLRSEIQTDRPSSLAATKVAIGHARRSAPHLLPVLHWCLAASAWAVGDPDTGLRAAREFAALDDDPAVQALRSAAGEMELPAWSGAALLGIGLFYAGQARSAAPLLDEARSEARRWLPAFPDLAALLNVIYLDELLGLTGPEVDARLADAANRLLDDSGENLAVVRAAQARRARWRGDWLIAERHAEEALTLARASHSFLMELWALPVVADLAALRGRVDAAALLAELRQLALSAGDRSQLVHADRSEGLLALAEGRLDDAIVHLQSAGDAGFAGGHLRDGVIPARVDLVEALVRAGDHPAAGARVAQLREVLTVVSDPLAGALLSRCEGLLAPTEEADDQLARALAAHSLDGDPFEEARTRLILGEHLRRTRRRTLARLELGQALAAFERLGAEPWASRTRGELRVAGATNYGSAQRERPSDLAALTPQELRVAKAVAEGLSNREAAAALFLSPRTVEFHLTSVFRKLNVTSRTGLARVIGNAASTDAGQ